MNLTIPTHQRTRVIVQVLAAVALACVTTWSSAAIDPDQSKLAPPAGDGWQVLAPAAAPVKTTAPLARPAVAALSLATNTSIENSPANAPPSASTAVTPVVLPGAPSAPPASLTFTVTPQDVNLRDALDRWLQKQGWQLAWKIDDDLPLEYNATFTGDFTSVLVQVMQATNHMRTPTRICRHTNNVIRVIARAANCQD